MLPETFDILPPVLRRFHDQSTASARGLLRVIRGSGRVKGLLADLAGLPRSGLSVPVLLRVESDRGRETWSRQFPTGLLLTRQWAERGLLMESVGPYRFGVKLSARADRLVFAFERAWIAGLPLPKWLAVRVDSVATASDAADSWWISVRISLPRLGLLASYEGEVSADWKQH